MLSLGIVNAQTIQLQERESIVNVGDDMIDGVFLDINGNTRLLSEYSGKYILVFFWSSNSTGFSPYTFPFQATKDISELYYNKLTIICISIDKEIEWKEVTSKYDILTWVNGRDPLTMRGVFRKYLPSILPYFVLISPENKIVDMWTNRDEELLKSRISENMK